MNKIFTGAVIGFCVLLYATCVFAEGSFKIKTRLDHFSGTTYVLVLSYMPSEITSITCQKWTMLGINSWKKQNEFTVPAGPSIAVMETNGFDGYCKGDNDIVAHTDDGDFVGHLDRGAGNWTDSTKLTFDKPRN